MRDAPFRRFSRWPDAAFATVAALVAFVVYLRTLLPDLGGPEDTPKFQYLGAVLGTAHQPGYPLHTILSYLMSWVPVGTIAYRADLLSAVCSATAVGLAVRLALALGCGRLAALAGGLGMAFGRTFWKYSVLAEVYSLSGALILGVMYWLVRWEQTSRPRHLYLACVCFALALGNHLSIVATGPAIAIFLLVSRSRPTLTWRRVLAAGAIVFSGFLQYTFVWIRSMQGAVYMESAANSLPGLVDVVRAKNYETMVFQFSWRQLLAEQLPALGRVVNAEIALAGLLGATLGAIALAVRDWRSASLLVLSILSLVGFVLNLFGDLTGFMVMPFALGGVLMAAGGDAIVRAVAGVTGRTGAVVAGVLLLVYPLQQLRANFETNDWSHRTEEATYFRAFGEQLPRRFALVPEDYVLDSMVTYLQATEKGDRAREIMRPRLDPQSIGALLDNGTPVYAFDKGQASLAPLGFDFEPVELLGPTLASLLAEVPRGSTIALAGVGNGLPVDVIRALRLESVAKNPGRARPVQALIATIGDASAELEQGDESVTATAEVPRSPLGGGHGERVPLVATAGPDGAAISIGERQAGAVDEGIVAVVLDSAGRIHAGYTAKPPHYRIALPQPAHRLYRLAGRLPTEPFGASTWHDVTAVAGDGAICVLIDNYRAFDARAIFYASGDALLRPALHRDYHGGTGEPAIDVQLFDRDRPGDRDALRAALDADGAAPEALGADRYATRIEYRVNDGGEFSASVIGFGGVPRRVIARGDTDLVNPRRAVAFSLISLRLLGRDHLHDVGVSEYFDWMIGAGWHRPQRDADGAVRWTAETDARLVLPLAEAPDLSIAMRVQAPPGATRRVQLLVNGRDAGACDVPSEWHWCRWSVPAGALHPGGNEVVLRTPEVSRLPGAAPGALPVGIAVRWIRLKRGR